MWHVGIGKEKRGRVSFHGWHRFLGGKEGKKGVFLFQAASAILLRCHPRARGLGCDQYSPLTPVKDHGGGGFVGKRNREADGHQVVAGGRGGAGGVEDGEGVRGVGLKFVEL